MIGQNKRKKTCKSLLYAMKTGKHIVRSLFPDFSLYVKPIL